MSKAWLVYLVVSVFTGSPVAGVIALLLVVWGADGWFRGRLWRPWALVGQWMRIRQLRTEIAANPHDATARAELGALLVERGRAKEAIEQLEPVVERCPTLAVPWANLGHARALLGDGNGARAAVQKATAIRKDVQYGAPWLRLGDLAFGAGDFATAIGDYERVVEVHSSSAEALFKIGRCRLALGDAAKARAAFQEAMAVGDAAPAFKRRIDRPWRWRAWWHNRGIAVAPVRQ